MLVPLPSLGLVYLGKFYLFFTAFCFAAMGNGLNLTDGLDGLAGGTAALAFIGMSIAVLPISSGQYEISLELIDCFGLPCGRLELRLFMFPFFSNSILC